MRVKLFNLNDVAQAVIMKNTAENDNASIQINFYNELDGAYLTMGFEPEYKDYDTRNEAFENFTAESLKGLFNNLIENSGMPLDKIL